MSDEPIHYAIQKWHRRLASTEFYIAINAGSLAVFVSKVAVAMQLMRWLCVPIRFR